MVLLLIRMAKALSRNRNGSRSGSTKYDAHQKVLSQTYGALADLRRELSDSKSAVAEREELLNSFSLCADSQRAWLLLEDYFEKLSLSRRDFPATDWWPRLLAAQGKGRPRRTCVSLFARAPLAPHGIIRPCQSEPIRAGGRSRAGTKADSRIGTLAVPAETGAPRFAARHVARHLPAAGGC